MRILHPLPAFTDNYIWAMALGPDAWVVDTGDAAPVLDWLDTQGLTLRGVWLTHHHADHTGGVATLRERTGAGVWGPAFEVLPEPVQRVSGGDTVSALGLDFQVIEVPGHTAGHVAFYTPDFNGAPLLFCGDTLFSGGCGRLFEGTPAQMLASLDALAALPGPTRVCCTHEYTLSNLRFAQAVEPHNADLAAYRQWCETQRHNGLPTLPSTLAQEKKINPFLRSREPSVIQAVQQQASQADGEVGVFAALRQWKDTFR